MECREDWDFGTVETRVWGLQALKHTLRMRFALQSTLMLRRPVEKEPDIARLASAAGATRWPPEEGQCYIVFDQRVHLQDPKDTAVERQLKAMSAG